jgi:ubiquinone/menaquinone biosynthesis C-methylase UbiE
MKQVDKTAYQFFSYAHPGRFVSYYYQLAEVLALDPKRVLEIGVGDGVFRDYLKNNTVIDYTSVDVADDLRPDVVGDVTNLPFQDEAFDVVCAFEVLEHIPFEKFEEALRELSRVSKHAVVLSLPHFGPPVKFLLKLPFLPEMSFSFKIPFSREHIFNGQHYWEIGKRGYSTVKIENILKKYFTIEKEFVPFENQYHHFCILRKQ